MSGSVQPGAMPGGFGGWGSSPGRSFDPYAFIWSVPKPLLIAGMVLGFIAFWPIGLAMLFFMLGTGRIGGKRWARRHGMMAGGGCGWGGPRGARPGSSASGNSAFDDYREQTLRRLEEEQQEFAAFLERLRVARDKAEFDQFMAERRQRPATPPDQPAQG